MKTILIALFFLQATFSFAETIADVKFNKGYDNIAVSKSSDLVLKLNLQKEVPYQVVVLQQGIDVMLILADEKNPKIQEMDSPNGRFGLEILEFIPKETKQFTLTVRKFEEETNADKGVISFYIKKFTPKEIALKKQTEKELAVENTKNVLTLDIDHFWEAFDKLKTCKNRWDSVMCIQNLYLDRATDGLKDFIRVRNFSAEGFVNTLAKLPKYYASVRPFTYESKKSEPLIQEVFDKLKDIYGNFKPFKVCFAIGIHNTGGTVSNRFILLGTEMVTACKYVDFSELGDNWKPSDTQKEPNIPLSIRGIVAHECIHTQQKSKLGPNAVVCNQLNSCIHEGAANFIGELLTGTTNYSAVNEYGDSHENMLWDEFKSTLCSGNASNWLYNGNTVKDRPADLGYYIGYRISQAYYTNASDKRQAIIDIIDMDDPLTFLQKSGYDQQKKN
ncbi:DUF2268 domain-containing putative Zn-dependent protease [Cytophagaceae bacterium YF14B1]|uniref:DUF2268 domain-containing putative Zn-dependent protease n=1 Tax=Xanthocytophaga flava TaxID=3048013 RepID=A0AAE3U6H1_9BACT|nr:DUF2268 domain-containing putative Zn-dependent protease [Xanthocytophaga flavus]MDJ1481844.1 DUF2268 domain-containing putative Zn-dependent protease [Xanthocytophaga flavus]